MPYRAIILPCQFPWSSCWPFLGGLERSPWTGRCGFLSCVWPTLGLREKCWHEKCVCTYVYLIHTIYIDRCSYNVYMCLFACRMYMYVHAWYINGEYIYICGEHILADCFAVHTYGTAYVPSLASASLLRPCAKSQETQKYALYSVSPEGGTVARATQQMLQEPPVYGINRAW